MTIGDKTWNYLTLLHVFLFKVQNIRHSDPDLAANTKIRKFAPLQDADDGSRGHFPAACELVYSQHCFGRVVRVRCGSAIIHGPFATLRPKGDGSAVAVMSAERRSSRAVCDQDCT